MIVIDAQRAYKEAIEEEEKAVQMHAQATKNLGDCRERVKESLTAYVDSMQNELDARAKQHRGGVVNGQWLDVAGELIQLAGYKIHGISDQYVSLPIKVGRDFKDQFLSLIALVCTIGDKGFSVDVELWANQRQCKMNISTSKYGTPPIQSIGDADLALAVLAICNHFDGVAIPA